ncbi:rCG29596 [Rattus norvegicus]|uniref:RCG29596 n=1 Tax=Rattus norvegicus TaxID=10116 RepID=A6ILE4_RAT|nr:rCG29596 [Rattus norvegicus]
MASPGKSGMLLI